jgi:hypothetical protein
VSPMCPVQCVTYVSGRSLINFLLLHGLDYFNIVPQKAIWAHLGTKPPPHARPHAVASPGLHACMYSALFLCPSGPGLPEPFSQIPRPHLTTWHCRAGTNARKHAASSTCRMLVPRHGYRGSLGLGECPLLWSKPKVVAPHH